MPYPSDDAERTRPQLCEGIRALARADQVSLLEPDGLGHLIVTAQSGDLVAADLMLSIAEDSALVLTAR